MLRVEINIQYSALFLEWQVHEVLSGRQLCLAPLPTCWRTDVQLGLSPSVTNLSTPCLARGCVRQCCSVLLQLNKHCLWVQKTLHLVLLLHTWCAYTGTTLDQPTACSSNKIDNFLTVSCNKFKYLRFGFKVVCSVGLVIHHNPTPSSTWLSLDPVKLYGILYYTEFATKSSRFRGLGLHGIECLIDHKRWLRHRSIPATCNSSVRDFVSWVRATLVVLWVHADFVKLAPQREKPMLKMW